MIMECLLQLANKVFRVVAYARLKTIGSVYRSKTVFLGKLIHLSSPSPSNRPLVARA